jgi:hypothetical protein
MSVLRTPDIKTLLLEKAKREKQLAKSKQFDLTDGFDKQNNFITDNSRFIAAQCSRRAGKSSGLAIKFFKTLEKHPGAQCIYLALTREAAFSIMWNLLIEFNEFYKLGCTFTESRLTMNHPNGSKLRLLGADAKNFIKRLRGIKTPGVAIDEAQDFGPHLQSLVDDILTPAMADYADSWLAITGTPGPVPNGYFFEVTQQKKYGYSLHKWTILDNPHMPNAYNFIEELKQKREWKDNNPTLLREWLNNWVLDVSSLWIKYDRIASNYTSLPSVPEHKLHYILGVDIGFNDADAIAVVCWDEKSSITYLVEEVIKTKQGVTELADQINALRKKYNPDQIVMDAGALGKKVHEELSRRHQIPVQAADKTRKQENVEFLNDALRTGRFKAKETSRFAQDSYLVQIDWDKTTPDRVVIKKQPHSDIIDAVLYAFKLSPAYTYQAPPVKPPYGSKAWVQAEVDKMFEMELEHLKEQEELSKWSKSIGFD